MSAQEQLNRYLKTHSKRPSKVRNMVLEQVCQLPQPFTAAQLIKVCEQERISVGTVYNTLELFIDAQLLHAIERQRGKAATEYELITGSANRFLMICKNCGRTVELSDPAIAHLIKERKYSNFNLQHYSLFVYGECKICRRKTIKKATQQ